MKASACFTRGKESYNSGKNKENNTYVQNTIPGFIQTAV